ncbi:MAG: hypothetical protein RL038_314 [Actinomycetota bacterium]
MGKLSPQTAPLAVRMRPQNVSDLVGQKDVLKSGSPLARLLTGESAAVSVILWGPPGTGKTTIAMLLGQSENRRFAQLSAISAGVKELRETIDEAKQFLNTYGRQTVLFIDEVHRFSKSQQDALLPAVENGWVILVAATTENPNFAIIAPLLSRSVVVRLQELADSDLIELLNRALTDARGLNSEIQANDSAIKLIAKLARGDARGALTLLEAAAGVADSNSAVIDDSAVNAAAGTALLNFDRAGDAHYDVASAFIKSMRGSDVDAALHYLARLIESGEDPRFIARRIVILASEDIGMADSMALVVAMNAMQAVSQIGMPEAGLTLAHATIYCALAPKSNAVTTAIAAARADIKAGNWGSPPAELRDSHYKGASAIGHGVGYQYPHDLPAGIAAFNYLPEAIAQQEYYQPSEHGAESRFKSIWQEIKKILRTT